MSLPRFDGNFNMAEDSRLLQSAEEGRFGWRVYGWDGPWVSLGCFQDPERDLLHPRRIPWVARPTGGKGVLHGHDVTVGLAAPLEVLARWSAGPPEPDGGSQVLSRTLRRVYRLTIAPIVQALRECGVPAQLGEELGAANPRSGPLGRTADCFAFVSANDVVNAETGQKVCGCALKLTQSAVLIQASIPAGPPLVDPSEVFPNASVPYSSDWGFDRFPSALEKAIQERVIHIQEV